MAQYGRPRHSMADLSISSGKSFHSSITTKAPTVYDVYNTDMHAVLDLNAHLFVEWGTSENSAIRVFL